MVTRRNPTPSVIALAGLAGLSSTVLAQPAAIHDSLSADINGYVYVNAASGEVVRTPAGPRFTSLYWQNDDIAGSCNYFFDQDDPARNTVATGRVKFGSALVHWGDVPGNYTLDGYQVAYATDVGCDSRGTGVSGYNMVNVFLDDYDGNIDPMGLGATVVAAFVLPDINGGDCTAAPGVFLGWAYTVDLEGTSDAFCWGRTDLDGDGLHDMGYTYEFEQNQAAPKAVCGPFLVRPASLGGLGSATGCPDAVNWFNQLTGPLTGYVGTLSFGGGSCSVPRPYASLFLNLYGPSFCCKDIDFNGDGIIDFADYLEFLNLFAAKDPRADLNQDGVWDFADYLQFLNMFDYCAR